MELLKRFLSEEDGQNIVEYTLMISLVVLVLWIAVTVSGINSTITSLWTRVNTQLANAPT